MKIKHFVVNMIEENCYLFWDETKEAVIVDAGCYYPEEQQALRDALPDTEISFYSLDDSSVDWGWRYNYSYFDMRDNLGMSYHV